MKTMTTILVEVQDETKVEDVYRFLKDIDFLHVQIAPQAGGTRRAPAAELAGTRITGDIMSPAVPLTDWKALQ